MAHFRRRAVIGPSYPGWLYIVNWPLKSVIEYRYQKGLRALFKTPIFTHLQSASVRAAYLLRDIGCMLGEDDPRCARLLVVMPLRIWARELSLRSNLKIQGQ